MLVLIKLIDDLIYHNMPVSALLKKSVFMMFSGVLGVALYGVILKALLAVFSVGLLDYQGINATASLEGIDLLGSLYVIKETFTNCFFDISP